MEHSPEPVVIGVDVAQASLETAFICGRSGRRLRRETLPNNAGGYAKLLSYVEPASQAHVVMEAAGNYHLGLLHALCEEGFCASAVNPLQVKRFGQMKLRRTKTDRSDALLIAAYGREQQPPSQQPLPEQRQQLRQIASLAEQLTKQRTALKNLEHAGSLLPGGAGICREVIREQLEQLGESLRRLEEEQERLVKAAYAGVRELAESVKGVGRKTATALVAYAGDLSGFAGPKQSAAYVELNPVAKQSGKSLDARMHISKQGHARLRTLFYMGAQSACRHNRACRELYERLVASGKRKKVALIAVAGKLLRQVFAVVKSGVAFDDQYGLKMQTDP